MQNTTYVRPILSQTYYTISTERRVALPDESAARAFSKHAANKSMGRRARSKGTLKKTARKLTPMSNKRLSVSKLLTPGHCSGSWLDTVVSTEL